MTHITTVCCECRAVRAPDNSWYYPGPEWEEPPRHTISHGLCERCSREAMRANLRAAVELGGKALAPGSDTPD